mgnify:CR=1 FL=1
MLVGEGMFRSVLYIFQVPAGESKDDEDVVIISKSPSLSRSVINGLAILIPARLKRTELELSQGFPINTSSETSVILEFQ